MPAIVLPTRLPLLARAMRAARAGYVRFLIRAAEQDVQHLRAEQVYAESLPDRIAVFEQHIAALRVRLIDVEAGR